MWFNPIMAWLLRSPLHGLISKGTALLAYHGRKSGKKYATPVNFVQDDNVIWVTSYRSRTWWRNLRGGAPATVYLRGKALQAVAEAIEEVKAVTAGLSAYLGKVPMYAKYFDVRLDSNGTPVAEDIALAASKRVMVRVRLD